MQGSCRPRLAEVLGDEGVLFVFFLLKSFTYPCSMKVLQGGGEDLDLRRTDGGMTLGRMSLEALVGLTHFLIRKLTSRIQGLSH